MRPTARLWTNDDTGYHQWIETHPNGFQANLYYPDDVSYFLVHKSTCRLPDRSHPATVDPRTGNQYAKLTADSIEELLTWGFGKGLKFGTERCRYCEVCKPELSSVDDAPPTADEAQFASSVLREVNRETMLRPVGDPCPKSIDASHVTHVRDPKVAAWVLRRARGACELCGGVRPPPHGDDRTYFDVHHLLRLCDGGADVTLNATAVCPNCHRRLHFGEDANQLAAELLERVRTADAEMGEVSHRKGGSNG